MAGTLQFTDTLTIIECGVCHISFAMPQQMAADRSQDGKDFWCPNGDKVHYLNPENARLKRQLDEALKSRDAAWTSRRAARDQAQAAERSARAYKGQVTRIRRRVGNGVCPCCNRTFADLARHMAGQHPDFGEPPSAT